MALTVTLSYTNEAVNLPLGYIGTLTDTTVYGGSNAARNTLAAYLTGFKIKQDTTVDAQVNVYSYNPLTATTYTFDILKDGWFRFKYIVVPFYGAGVVYNQYDVQYTSGVVYQRNGVSVPSAGHAAPDATYWTVVSDPTTIVDAVGTATAAGNISGVTPTGGYQLFEQVIYPFNKTSFGNATETAALDCCSNCDRSEEVLNYEFLGVLVDGMNVTNQRSKFSKGEKMARKADEVTALL